MQLKTNHPVLMVPHVVSLGVVVYTNGNLPPLNPEVIRQCIASQLPAGCGVSSIQLNIHGVYDGKQGAS
jgi:hypothetical protein